MGDLACAHCGHPAVMRTFSFRENTSGKDELMWTLSVPVCTHAPCLVRQGGAAVPVVKKLASGPTSS
jgi:hypothetical protein